MRLKAAVLLFLILSVRSICPAQSIPCPSIDAGGDVTICNGQCTRLLANVNTNYATTSYSVGPIAYAPYPFTGTPILVNQDDIWSAPVNLGFNFCYYGNTYRKVVIGANGQISFDTTKAGKAEPWIISKPIPDTSNSKNTICATYRDIDPALGGNVYYQVVGTAPCRALFINWSNIPLFGYSSSTSGTCNGISFSTFQAVLYETTNIVDVYIQNSSACTGWNSGSGIIGIQNATGTVGVSPPGRNYPSAWTATNEAWRFSPTGVPSYTVTWSDAGTPIGTGLGITVCPTANKTYTSKMVVTNCDGTNLTYSDSLKVTVNSNTSFTPAISVNSSTICLGSTATLTATGGSVYSWSPVSGLNKDTGAVVMATPSVTTTYTVTGSGGSCADTSLSIVKIVVPQTAISISTIKDTICNGGATTLVAAGATSYTWSPSTSLSSATGATVTATPTTTTLYTVTAQNSPCVNNSTSNFRVFVVQPISSATITAPALCAGSCTGTTYVTVTGGLGNHYLWSTGITTYSVSNLCPGTYSVQISNSYCTGTYTSSVNITAPPPITVTTSVAGCTCLNGNNGSISVGASGGNGAPYSYALNTGTYTTSSVFSSLATGTYTVNVRDKNNCLKSITVVVPQTATNVPSIAITSDTLCLKDSTILHASGALTYTWSPSTYLSAASGTSVTCVPLANITYTVYGTDAVGCRGYGTGGIVVSSTYTVYPSGKSVCTKTDTSTTITVYNSFSPNGDGLNDFFEIDNIDKHTSNHVYIYNRWGQLLWDKENYDNKTVAWDGKDKQGNALAPGTYFYLIEIKGQKTLKHWLELTR
ncbi:MAG: T9SS type B sorting domain-containing protein [Bacteroidia bacterium]